MRGLGRRDRCLTVAIRAAGFKTDSDFARAVGIHPSTLSQILNGRIRASTEERQKIALALHVPSALAFPDESVDYITR
jgi:transcriptional regulator with XRE-family HTH domain